MRIDTASLEKGKFLVCKGSGTLKQIVGKIQDLILTIQEDNKPESDNYNTKFDLILKIEKSSGLDKSFKEKTDGLQFKSRF